MTTIGKVAVVVFVFFFRVSVFFTVKVLGVGASWRGRWTSGWALWALWDFAAGAPRPRAALGTGGTQWHGVRGRNTRKAHNEQKNQVHDH